MLKKLPIIYLIILLRLINASYGQVYLQNKSKYRFAQGAMGVDFQYISHTGTSNTITKGKVKNYQFGGFTVPRIVIGGLHFWGHADIAFNIPVGEIGRKQDSIAINYSDFDIMTFKYYPWAIKKGGIRPYIGTSVNINTYSQQGTDEYKTVYGGRDFKLGFPLNAGLSYQVGSWLLNVDGKLNLNRDRKIYASRTETTNMKLPSYSLSVGVRKLFESTTTKFEKKYEDGTMKIDYEKAKNKLNAFSFAVGLSTSIYTATSDYNKQNRRFLSNRSGASFLEYGFGYYLDKSDIHFNLAYRQGTSNDYGFGINQKHDRTAYTLEAYKFLFDYKGFVPFLGIGINKENLKFTETDFQKTLLTASNSKITPNISFGWDIRYHRLNWLMLRTNMRYFPVSGINTLVGKIKFNQMEMNFIQAVIYPQRFKYVSKK
jgi:outer membrane protein W